MFAIEDGQRLYLSNWGYNAMLIMDEMRKLIVERGGHVAPYKTAIISNRTLESAIRENQRRLDRARASAGDKSRLLERINQLTADIAELEALDNAPIATFGQSWIKFSIDGYFYTYSLDDNPFFAFYFSKARVMLNKGYRADACCQEDPKEWWDDRFITFGCSDFDRSMAAENILDMLLRAPDSKVPKITGYQRGPNGVVLCERHRYKKIDF